jgi:translation initiation factor 4G
MIDLADLSKKVPSKQEDPSAAPSAKKEETTERRPVSIRLETADAHKKRIEEEKLKDKDWLKKDEDLAKLKAKRDAEAKERAERDQGEKERRQREQDEADRKKLDEERAKRGAEEAEKERIKREEGEREREKERLERLEEDAAERARMEAEEKEKARLAEIEAQKKEEEAAKRKAVEEAKRKEEVARKAAEEAARLEAEAKQKAQEEETKRLKEEGQEAAVAATDSASQASTPLDLTLAYASPALSVTALPKSALPASLDPKRRPISGFDLPSTNLPRSLPSALASARIIRDIRKISYPEGIKAPSNELNLNASSGKFRYVYSRNLITDSAHFLKV